MALTKFTIFPTLPPELRNKIWYHVAIQEPRTIDLWTDFKRCEIDNTIFYTQTYECEPSNRPPRPIFRASRESRREAQNFYAHEYATEMNLPNGISVQVAPKFHINYISDTLIPRGYWNVISFDDLVSRVKGSLKFIAIDVNGSFWTDNLRDYCKNRVWPFAGLDELIVYDSSTQKMFKGSEYLEKFRERYKDGPKDLGFSDCEEPTQKMNDVKAFLEKSFDRIEGKVAEEVVYGEDGLPVPVKAEKIPSYLKRLAAIPANELRRPMFRMARLKVSEPAVVPI